ncbi:MAG: HEAT repeat domain-containing protein [Gemmatimonadota bacterium]|nr:HEAT repeat domain-containing protein [Gemmatimonadota bacterium]
MRGYGWGDWSDAPSTPLARFASSRVEHESGEPPVADIEFLLESLGSDDARVRELSVRLLGRYRNDNAVSGLIARLGSPSAPLREVSALGLGLVKSARTADALLRALRDATPGVRANAAWALGRIEHGRALAPLSALFQDSEAKVREASVIAAGRMDSTSVAPALIRVIRQDDSPAVRRAAAWALGHLESREQWRRWPASSARTATLVRGKCLRGPLTTSRAGAQLPH